MYPWSVCVCKLKYPSSSPLPELVEAGGFLQGDQGSVMTPGFPEQNYESGALYQVCTHTTESILKNGVHFWSTRNILFDYNLSCSETNSKD